MIRGFGDKRTRRIYSGDRIKRMPEGLLQRTLEKLDYLEQAQTLDDLRIPPSNRLQKKKGDLKDYYSIRVNDQWRLIFRWVDGHAEDVTFVDYH